MSNKIITKKYLESYIDNNIDRSSNEAPTFMEDVYYHCYSKNIFNLDTSLLDVSKCLAKEDIDNSFSFSTTNMNATDKNKLVSEKNTNGISLYKKLCHINNFKFEHPGMIYSDIPEVIKSGSFSLGISKNAANMTPYVINKNGFNIYYIYDNRNDDDDRINLNITGFYLKFINITNDYEDKYNIFYEVQEIDKQLVEEDFKNESNLKIIETSEIINYKNYIGKKVFLTGVEFKGISNNNYTTLELNNILGDNNEIFFSYNISINNYRDFFISEIKIKNNILNSSYLEIKENDILYDIEIVDKEEKIVKYSSYGNRGKFKFPINDIKEGEYEEYRITFYAPYFDDMKKYEDIDLTIFTESIYANDFNEPYGVMNCELPFYIITESYEIEGNNIYLKDRRETHFIENNINTENKFYNNLKILKLPLEQLEVNFDGYGDNIEELHIIDMLFSNYSTNTYLSDKTLTREYYIIPGAGIESCTNECLIECTNECLIVCTNECTNECEYECLMECIEDCNEECTDDQDGDNIEDDFDTCMFDENEDGVPDYSY